MSSLELENVELKRRLAESDSRYNSLKVEHNRIAEKYNHLVKVTSDLERFKTVIINEILYNYLENCING